MKNIVKLVAVGTIALVIFTMLSSAAAAGLIPFLIYGGLFAKRSFRKIAAEQRALRRGMAASGGPRGGKSFREMAAEQRALRLGTTASGGPRGEKSFREMAAKQRALSLGTTASGGPRGEKSFREIAAEQRALRERLVAPSLEPEGAKIEEKPGYPREMVEEERLVPLGPSGEIPGVLEELEPGPMPAPGTFEELTEELPSPEMIPGEEFEPFGEPVEDILEEELEWMREEVLPGFGGKEEIEIPPGALEEGIKLSEEISGAMDKIDAELEAMLGPWRFPGGGMTDAELEQELAGGDEWWDEWRRHLDELLS